MARTCEFPVFDADNHLYETEDALTRHLPEKHRNLFRFVAPRMRLFDVDLANEMLCGVME